MRVAGASRAMAAGLAVGATAAAAATVAAGAAVYKAADKWATFVDELDETSKKANVSATYLKDLRFSLGELGVEQGSVDSGLVKFNATLGKMKATGAPKALEALAPGLAKMAIAAKDGDAANRLVIGYLSNIEDGSKRAAIALQIYGKSAGPAIAGAAGDVAALNSAFARSRKMTGVIGPDAVKLAGEYEISMNNLKGTTSALGMIIGKEAVPGIIKMADRFTDFVVANRGLIASKSKEFFKKLGDAIERIDWEAFGQGMIKFIDALPGIAKLLGTVAANIDKIFYAWVAVQAVSFGSGFISVFGGAKKAAGALGLFANGLGAVGKAGPKLSYFAKFKKGIAGVGPALSASSKTGGFVKGLTRLGPLLMRIPALFGPIGMAVSAAAIGGTALFANWDKLGPVIKQKTTQLGKWFTGLADVDFFAAGQNFASKIGAMFASINFAAIGAGLGKIATKIGAFLSTLDFAAMGGNFGAMIGKWIAGVDWGAVGGVIWSVVSVIGKIMLGAVQFIGGLAWAALTAAFGLAFGALRGIAATAWEGIKSVIGSAIDAIVAKINYMIQLWNSWAPKSLNIGTISAAGAGNAQAARGAVAAKQSYKLEGNVSLVLKNEKGKVIGGQSVPAAQLAGANWPRR